MDIAVILTAIIFFLIKKLNEKEICLNINKSEAMVKSKRNITADGMLKSKGKCSLQSVGSNIWGELLRQVVDA